MDARQRLYRKSKSDNPDVAFPALVKLGKAIAVPPTTDTGYKSYGTGRLFLPASTNLCTSPAFAIDTDENGLADSWTTAGYSSLAGTPVYTRASIGGGRYSQRMQYTGVAGDGVSGAFIPGIFTGASSVAEGDVVTFSLTLSGSLHATVHAHLTIIWHTAGAAPGGYVAQTDANITPSATPTRVSVSGTAPATTTRVFCCLLVHGPIHDGDDVDLTISDVLIEKSAVLTPYYDGTYPNCAWTGTANASTSTRTGSTLAYPPKLGGYDYLPNAGGTVAVRTIPLYASPPSASQYFLLGRNTADDTNHLQFYLNTGPNYCVTVWDGATSSSAARTPGGFVAGTQHSIVARVTATTLDINWNGTDGVQGANNSTNDFGGPFYVGGLPAAAAYPHYVGPLLISPTQKSAGWVTAIQASSGKAYTEPTWLWNNYCAIGDVLAPLSSNSTAYVKVG